MESGAKGCEVVVSGKLRGQRAKSMKFVDGLMIHSGDPVNYYVDTAVRHVLLRQGECSSTKCNQIKLPSRCFGGADVCLFNALRCAGHQGEDHAALGPQR